MSASAAPPPSELQLRLLPPRSQDNALSNSSEGSKKRAISEVAEDSAAPPADGSGDGKSPAKKKTKLTEAEVEEKRKEKEAKEKEKEDKRREKEAKEKEKEVEKAAKKAERDEKKRIRDEERKKKDEEKKKKDDEKKKKDDEKKKKDDERAKKDRAQTRLQNFFVKPSGPPSSPAKAAAAPPDPTTDTPEPNKKENRSDYERTFHSFFVKPNVTVACFQRDDVYKATVKGSIDLAMSFPKDSNSPEDQMKTVPGVGTATSEQIAELLHIPLHKRGRRGKLLGYTTKDLLARINAPDDSSLPPIIDQTKAKSSKEGAAVYLGLLNSLPNKFLRFAEDVRPPYSGTFTRNPTKSGLRKGRNPFQRALPKVTYDYDSEVEWEEDALDEDGEELLSDNEEEDEEAESLDDEMDEFLDDEDDEAKGRRGHLAALVPLSSGLCWEDEGGRNSRVEFGDMRMEVLIEGVSGPIDPLSTIYWNPPPKNTKSLTNFLVSTASLPKPSTSTSMEPPRLPLAASTRPRVTNIALGIEAGTPKKGKSVSLVPAEDLDAFKRAVEGSDMTKAGLIEVLKKQFPKIGKESIKQTLGKVAARVGDREKDKRWVLI